MIMAIKYPKPFNIRLTDEDMQQLEEVSKKLDTPRSILIRRAWREWFANQQSTPSTHQKASAT